MSLTLAGALGCGPPPCDAASCPGCCDVSGVCRVASSTTCGRLGTTCVACPAGTSCQSGACMGFTFGGSGAGGGVAGGASGGGAAAGGAAGGDAADAGAGGSAGGGGPAGGSAAGGSAGGGGPAGGSAAGGSAGGGGPAGGSAAGGSAGGGGPAGGSAAGGSAGGAGGAAAGGGAAGGSATGGGSTAGGSAAGGGSTAGGAAGGGATAGGAPDGGVDGGAPCNAVTCPSGCCDPVLGCQSGQTNTQCGWRGATCRTCLGASTCRSQACSISMGFAGANCGNDNNCFAADGSLGTSQGTCLQPPVWIGGYCAPPCSTTNCARGSCVAVDSSGPRCFGNCQSPGAGRSDCRAGYVCETLTLGATTAPFGFCFPSCGGIPGFCPPGTSCGSLGYCL
jgi:hypothetical protein